MAWDDFFDTAWHLSENIETVDSYIKDAERPKPPKVTRHYISIIEFNDDNCKYGVYLRDLPNFKTFDEALKWAKENVYIDTAAIDMSDKSNYYKTCYYSKICNRYYVIKEYDCEEYEDGEYYLEWSDEAIKQVKHAKRVLSEAKIYLNRLYKFFGCDDSDETFIQRLKEDLEALDAELK